jgi:hypothetical protein
MPKQPEVQSKERSRWPLACIVAGALSGHELAEITKTGEFPTLGEARDQKVHSRMEEYFLYMFKALSSKPPPQGEDLQTHVNQLVSTGKRLAGRLMYPRACASCRDGEAREWRECLERLMAFHGTIGTSEKKKKKREKQRGGAQ